MSYLESRDAKRIVPNVFIRANSALDDRRVKKYIRNIDFSMLIYKLSVPDANISRVWDVEAAEIAVGYYRNFLWLMRKYGHAHVLAPSTEIDEIWHHHILDTYKYHEDCNAIFGAYLHHYPYFGMRGDEDLGDLRNSFATTQSLHFQEFGSYIMGFEEETVKLSSVD